MKKFIAFLTLTTLLLSACNNATVKTESAENSEVSDPLPSWNEGATKTAIIEFVTSVSKEGGSVGAHDLYIYLPIQKVFYFFI